MLGGLAASRMVNLARVVDETCSADRPEALTDVREGRRKRRTGPGETETNNENQKTANPQKRGILDGRLRRAERSSAEGENVRQESGPYDGGGVTGEEGGEESESNEGVSSSLVSPATAAPPAAFAAAFAAAAFAALATAFITFSSAASSCSRRS